MLNPSQIKWAASHDWFVRDNGNGTIVVEEFSYDPSLQASLRYLQSWVGGFRALREWAGY